MGRGQCFVMRARLGVMVRVAVLAGIEVNQDGVKPTHLVEEPTRLR